MSDFPKERRRRAGRGSLLDHAAGANSVQPSAHEQVRGTVGVSPMAPAKPASTARLSTSRYAENHEPVPAPARDAASRLDAHPKSVNSGRESFGDRITRLIGTVPPQADKVGPPVTPEEPVSPEPAAAPPRGPREQNHQRQAADREQAWGQQDPGRDDHYHWHAAGHEDESRPLLDVSILMSSVWRYRFHIAATTVAGAVLGALLALSTPHKYYAESRLFVDPREIGVTEDDVRSQQLSTEAMLAITDSQLQILTSTSVLEKVIRDLGLEKDLEFNGTLSAGGIGGGLTLIKELITGNGGATDAEQKTLEKLRDAVSASRDAKTFVIILGVLSRDAKKSALIANQIVKTYLDAEGRAQSNLLERTSESIDARVNSLRSDLDAAEREVERFKAENGLVGVGGKLIDDNVILALSDQLATARAMKIGIKVKADNLARVKLDDVLSGAFPEEMVSTNLTELRKQYTQTRSTAEALSTRLGPRHPQYIAARSALETISKEIGAELRRIVASSQNELQRAVETEQELASQMAVAKSRAMDQSIEFVTLRELERKATATRGIYEAFLTRSRETSERSNLTTRNIRVISPAEAPLESTGPSRKIIAIGGMFAGFFAGVGLALLAGAVESIRGYNSGPAQARFQNPPFDEYPRSPEPGPRTSPDGSGRRSRARRDENAEAFDAAADEATAGAFATAGVQPGYRYTGADPVSSPPAGTEPSPRDGLGSMATRRMMSGRRMEVPEPAVTDHGYRHGRYAHMAGRPDAAAGHAQAYAASARQPVAAPANVHTSGIESSLWAADPVSNQPPHNEAAARIRREMEMLQSRIASYRSAKGRG